MSSKQFVTNTIPPLFVRHVRQNGGDADKLIRQFKLPDDVEKQQEARISVGDLKDLAVACEQSLKDPFLGLHVAQSVESGRYGLLEFVARSAASVREGFRQFCRYRSLVDDAVHFRISEVRKDAVFDFAAQGIEESLGRHINEYTLCIMLRMGRMICPQPWPVKSAWFAHAKPDDVGELEKFLGTQQLDFKSRSSGARFDAAILDVPLTTADAALHHFLEQQASTHVASKREESFLDTVRARILFVMQKGDPQIERVSSLLHCSARTLQRRLADEGTSFQDLLDDVRQEHAMVMLEDPRRNLGEVAFMLGYADIGPFVRAFKRWTGTTPGEYRKARVPEA